MSSAPVAPEPAPAAQEQPSPLGSMAENPDFATDGGVYCQPPPCLRSSWFASVCETSRFCVFCGGCGVKGLQKYRVPVMYSATAVSLIAVILQLVAVISLSHDAKVIRDTHWTHASATAFDRLGQVRDEFDFFLSVTAVAVYNRNNASDPTVVAWADASCENEDVAEFCEDCMDSSLATESVAITAFVTSIFQVTTDLQRSTYAGDFNCQRSLGIITGILAALTTLASLLTYRNGCGRDLPTTVDFADGGRVELEYETGPGLICLTIATVLKFYDVLCHLLITTPDPKRGPNAKELLRSFWSSPREDMERQLISHAYT